MAEDVRDLNLESVRRFLAHEPHQNEISSQSNQSNQSAIWQNDPFSFLQFVIFFVVAAYAVIVFVFALIRRRDMQLRENTITQSRNNNDLLPFDDSSTRFYAHACRSIWSKTFRQRQTDVEDYLEASGESLRVQWSTATLILAICRVASLALFIIICVDTSELWLPMCFPLSSWNALLAVVYFSVASIASAIGLWKRGTVSRSRDRVLAKLTQILAISMQHICEVSAGTAVFAVVWEAGITIPITSNALPALNFIPVPVISIIPFMLELFMNNLEVRADQYPACAMWFLLYLFLLWPLVYFGQVRTWPNNYLETETALCIFKYMLLMVIHLLSYLLCYIFYKLKIRLAGSLAWLARYIRRHHNSDASSNSGSTVTNTSANISRDQDFFSLYSPSSDSGDGLFVQGRQPNGMDSPDSLAFYYGSP